ncbi:hypothetical protein Pcinc_031375 [Petrolisthes cinctipes]|uniref:CUB domain-containing protein n=1 Tax=Petrolisthes cinctipes TaxID=88211 RepID=A0AAE1EWR8_PETCI|nr:hypothetical protein Pcinc_031375 [Petrolisthes cinctipes]
MLGVAVWVLVLGVAVQQGAAIDDLLLCDNIAALVPGHRAVIQSPNFPSYNNNENCEWEIICLPEDSTELHVTWKYQSFLANDCGDSLTFEQSSGSETLCGRDTPTKTITDTGYAKFTFVTDESITGAGFRYFIRCYEKTIITTTMPTTTTTMPTTTTTMPTTTTTMPTTTTTMPTTTTTMPTTTTTMPTTTTTMPTTTTTMPTTTTTMPTTTTTMPITTTGPNPSTDCI